VETAFLNVRMFESMIGIEAMIVRLNVLRKVVTIGSPGTTGTAVNQGGGIGGLSVREIARRNVLSNDLWTIVIVRGAVAVDNGIRAVVTEAEGGISGITGISAHKVAVVDIGSSKAVATIRSVIRIMEVAVAARVALVNSRKLRRSQWCRRSR